MCKDEVGILNETFHHTVEGRCIGRPAEYQRRGEFRDFGHVALLSVLPHTVKMHREGLQSGMLRLMGCSSRLR